MIFSKRELGSLADSWRDFLKSVDLVSKTAQVPLPNPKNEFVSKKSTKNLFTHF